MNFYILGHVGYIGQAQARLGPGEFLQAGPGFTIAWPNWPVGYGTRLIASDSVVTHLTVQVT